MLPWTQGHNNGPYQWTNSCCLKEPGKLLSNILLSFLVYPILYPRVFLFPVHSEDHVPSFLPREIYETTFSGISFFSFTASQSPLLFLFNSQLTVKLRRSGSALPSLSDFKSLPTAWPYLLCKIYLATHCKFQFLCDPRVPDRELKRVFRSGIKGH